MTAPTKAQIERARAIADRHTGTFVVTPGGEVKNLDDDIVAIIRQSAANAALAAIIETQEWAAGVAESMFSGSEWESARTNAGIIIGGYIRAGQRDKEPTQ